jgi:WD40 repeat protein
MLVLSFAALSISPAAAQAVRRDPVVCFVETGFCAGYPFGAAWQEAGGLESFGLALGPVRVVNEGPYRDRLEQDFERVRLEHASRRTDRGVVTVARLGVERLRQLGVDVATFPPSDAAAPHYFPETRQALAPEFAAAFWGSGLEFGDPGVSPSEAIARHGLPIAPPQPGAGGPDDPVLIQYTERSRFELHERAGERRVELGRLGAEVLATAPRPLNPLSPGPPLVAVDQGRRELLVRIAPVGMASRSHHVWLMRGDGTASLLDERLPELVPSPAWSPNGDRLALLRTSDDGTGHSLDIVERSGSRSTLLAYPQERAIPGELRWRADGAGVLASYPFRSFGHIGPDGSEQMLMRGSSSRLDLALRPSPDGKRLAWGHFEWGFQLTVTIWEDYPAGAPLTTADWYNSWASSGQVPLLRTLAGGHNQSPQLLWGPDSRLLLVGLVATDGRPAIYLLDSVDRTARQSRPDCRPLRTFRLDLDLSPDGRRVALTCERSGMAVLLVIDLATGEEQTLATRTADHGLTLPRWTPDGAAIAVVEAGDQVVLFDAATGAAASLSSLPRGRVIDLAWSGSRR